MSTGYLLLWSASHLAWMQRLGEVGRRLEVIYGSPHGSAPSLRRYGVSDGDTVFIVRVKKSVVHIVARIVVASVIDTDAYFRDHLRLGDELLAMHLWDLSTKLAASRPDLGHRLPFGCVEEVGLLESSTPLGLDLPIPPATLSALESQPKRGPAHTLPTKDGKLAKMSSIQGHFIRLTDRSRDALNKLVEHELPKRTRFAV